MNSFEERIREMSDEEMINILTRSQEYQPEFVELIKKALNERNVFYEPEEQTDQTPTLGSGQTEEEIINQVYDFTANLLFEQKYGKQSAISELVDNGIDAEVAEVIVENLLSSRDKRAKNNMIYGALWCIGGSIATAADLGYIFWGAIVFGAVQFFRGLSSHS